MTQERYGSNKNEIAIIQTMRNKRKRCVKFKQDGKKDNKSSLKLIAPEPNDDMEWNQDNNFSYLLLSSSSSLPF